MGIIYIKGIPLDTQKDRKYILEEYLSIASSIKNPSFYIKGMDNFDKKIKSLFNISGLPATSNIISMFNWEKVQLQEQLKFTG